MLGGLPAWTPALAQAVGAFDSWTQLLLNLYEMVGGVLGLFIAYLAYRGYRRNDSRPMLFIALGFALILAPGLLLFAVALVVPSLPQTATQVLLQTFEIVGMLSIVYALRMDPDGER